LQVSPGQWRQFVAKFKDGRLPRAICRWAIKSTPRLAREKAGLLIARFLSQSSPAGGPFTGSEFEKAKQFAGIRERL
jgi:hypothetical protein